MSNELVKIKDLIEWTGTVEDFLKKIAHNNPGYLKKDKGRTIVHMWWENDEKWFMNVAKQNNSSLDDSGGWYIAKQMPRIMDQYLREGYLMYLNQNKDE